MLRSVTSVLLFALIFLLPANSQSSTPPYLEQAFLGVNTLQSWYQPSTGLYQTTGWWNAANAITVLANYSRLDRTTSFYPVFSNTLQQAQTTFPHFINDYYDDEGWWALAWIDAYDLTGDARYLSAAQTIFTDMTGGWDSTCGGGIWWSKARNYKNAIANELFLSVAASLAARSNSSATRAAYLHWAQQEWTWFHASGMINSHNTINDGLDNTTCKNNGQTVWSYNQGVILGGLTQLSKVDADKTLVPEAQTIANAAITALTDSNGILHDVCEPNCGGDGPQFKGVFLRNLTALQAVVHDPRYTGFATTNANSIFTGDRSSGNAFGVVWSGPFDNNPNAASQGSALDAILAAAATTSGTSSGGMLPSFTLTATPATLHLQPGGSAQTTIALSPDSGFTGTVNLTVTPTGTATGITATLSSSTLSGKGSTTLEVRSSSSTPGGSYTLAITGTGNGQFQAAYVSVVLPDFSVNAAQTTLYLDQSDRVEDPLAISPLNGFDEYINLDTTGLPRGVSGHLRPRSTATTSVLTLSATPLAATGSGTPFTLTGTSGATTHTAPGLSVAVSAARSNCGFGIPVDLSKAFNLTALHSDGSTYTDGGLDGLGYSFSSTLLGTARVLNGIRYTLAAQDKPNAVYANGQILTLPHGRYNTLQLLGTGINGRQGNQTLTVTYTDGSTTVVQQGFSDWYSPAFNASEAEAVAMPYRNQANGTPQQVQFNLYSYTLSLDNGKQVASLTLPSNRSVVLLAATLSLQEFGHEINLAPFFNLAGITTDGTGYNNIGVDGDGYTYSANALGDLAASGTDVKVNTASFHLAAANTADVVYAHGQTLPVPSGAYQSLRLLGAAVGGNQLDQPLVLHYKDGSSETRTQTFSDWYGIGNFPNEALAIRTPYRNKNDGSTDNEAFNLYVYTLHIGLDKRVTSITLPNNRSVLLFGMTAVSPSVLELAPDICGTTLP